MHEIALISQRHARRITAGCLVAVGGLLAVHYSTSLGAPGVHDFLRRLFYLPVAVAAIAAGTRGGALTVAAITAGYLPHVVQLARAGNRILDHLLELIILLAVGLLVGAYADSARRARSAAAERGRLAALGEVGLVVFGQLEGPLSSIEGQTVSLTVAERSGSGRAVGFAIDVIQKEVARARLLLRDMRDFGSLSRRAEGKVDLPALVRGVVEDVVTAHPRMVRVSTPLPGAGVRIRADRGALAHALRSLLFGILDSVAVDIPIEVEVLPAEPNAVVVRIWVRSARRPLPDLRRAATRVFGPGATDYRFDRALWDQLLLLQGGQVEFDRISPRETVVRVTLPWRTTEGLHALRNSGSGLPWRNAIWNP